LSYYDGITEIERGDPMIRSKRDVALEPVRIVVPFTAAEFALVDRANEKVAPGDYPEAACARARGSDWTFVTLERAGAIAAIVDEFERLCS
jgi:hypothetical protein